MKIKLKLVAIYYLLSAIGFSAFAQGTAFTYQGRLNSGGNPANGLYDMTFNLYNTSSGGSAVAGPVTLTATGVTNGLFTVTVDYFGIFSATPGTYWLDISVRTNGSGSFTELTPRQQITPAPYAIDAAYAGYAAPYNHSVSLFSLQTDVPFPNQGWVLAINASGNLTWTNPATANSPNTIVSRDGSGSFAAGSITLANTLALPATVSSSIGVLNLGGVPFLHGYGNYNTFVGPGAGNFTMSGSGNTAIGFQALFSNTTGYQNTANGSGALFSNTTGRDNTANGINALGGNTNGNFNTANGVEALEDNTSGSENTASGMSALFFNTTGNDNTAHGFHALYSNTSGSDNTANGVAALYANMTGMYNTASGNAALYSNTNGDDNTATGVGALQNLTTGVGNIAIGFQAGYNLTSGNDNIDIGNQGTSGDDHIIRIGSNQAATYLAGNVNIIGTVSFGAEIAQTINLYNTQFGIGIQNFTEFFRTGGEFDWYAGGAYSSAQADPGTGGTRMMQLTSSGLTVNGTFVSASDRNVKAGFEPVDAGEVLRKVTALPITRWHYTNDVATPHLGPVAQDFYTAFNVGPDDRHIAVVDEGGVALAAIQGLNQKVQEGSQRSEVRIQKLEAENTELKQRLEALEKIILSQNSN